MCCSGPESGPYSPQPAGNKRRYDDRDGPPDAKRQAIGAAEGPQTETVYRLLVQSKKVCVVAFNCSPQQSVLRNLHSACPTFPCCGTRCEGTTIPTASFNAFSPQHDIPVTNLVNRV